MPARLDGRARARRAARLGITPGALKHRERRERERVKQRLEAKPWIGEPIPPDAPTNPSKPA